MMSDKYEEYVRNQVLGERRAKSNPFLDWRVWVGAVAMMLGLYAFIWVVAIACVWVGGSPEVCGL